MIKLIDNIVSFIKKNKTSINKLNNKCSFKESTLEIILNSFNSYNSKYFFKNIGEYNIGLDVIKEPTQKINNTDIVRKLPYPFYSACSIPSDCCGSDIGGLFFTQSKISREYGLDFPSSFFAHSDYSEDNPAVSFFSQLNSDYALNDININGKSVSRLTLMLHFYYRGWIDHLHSWSNAGSFSYSICNTIKMDKNSKVIDIPLVNYPHGFQLAGFVINIKYDIEDLDSLVILFKDSKDKEYTVSLEHDDIKKMTTWCMLPETTPLIIDFKKYFGEDIKSIDFLKAIKISVRCKQVILFKVYSIIPFSFTSDTVDKHIENLKKKNILPFISSYHGGFSYWHVLLKSKLPPIDLEINNINFSIERANYGGIQDSPIYISDKLHDYGCIGLGGITGIVEMPTSMNSSSSIEITGKKFFINERFSHTKEIPVPSVSGKILNMEELGGQIASFLKYYTSYGNYMYLYTHFNSFSNDTFFPSATSPVHMSDLYKFHPFTEQAFNLLSLSKYDLKCECKYWQRIWSAPYSVLSRHQLLMENLSDNITYKNGNIYITSWHSLHTNKLFPNKDYISQDLHGATFYVENSINAKLFVDNKEIKCFKRNKQDFTNKESITIIDVTTPTVIFDEIDFSKYGGSITLDNAMYIFNQTYTYSGLYSMEVSLVSAKMGSIIWKPNCLDSNETDYFRFAYKKSNPLLNFSIIIYLKGQKLQTVVTDNTFSNMQGWIVPFFEDSKWHEVIVDYADMQLHGIDNKIIPRGEIEKISFEISNGLEGDSIYFDSISFLSARGVRPRNKDNGFVIGGQYLLGKDNIIVNLTYNNIKRYEYTKNGGWFMFDDIPQDIVFEISCIVDNKVFFPLRGRYNQAVKNDLEFNI